MNTAAGVEILWGCGVQSGTVGMARDQSLSLLRGIVGQASFHPVLMGIVFCSTGGIQHTEMFQRLPEISYQKTGKRQKVEFRGSA